MFEYGKVLSQPLTKQCYSNTMCVVSMDGFVTGTCSYT